MNETSLNKISHEATGIESGRISFRFLVFIALVAALIPVALLGWRDLAPLMMRILEVTAPQISITEMPRGVGLAPASIKILLSDQGSGLDEIIVRTVQRGVKKDLLREALGGREKAEIRVDFPGDRSALDEGSATLEIKAFDRSFWSNVAEKQVPLEVDFRKPRIEVLTTQHNATVGGSQLIFYKAFDERLAVSGVKAGAQTFLGYPASGIDESFDGQSLFVAIYAADMNAKSQDISVRAFAEDNVGNAVSVPFYNKVLDRPFRAVTQQVSEEALRERIAPIADENFNKLREVLQRSGRDLVYETPKGGVDRLLEQFRYVNEILRQFNEDEILSLLKKERYERFWDGPFFMHPGTVTGAFGDDVTFIFNGQVIGKAQRKGYEFTLPPEHPEVYAANNGIVIFSDNLGVYGRCVGIDHGLGIVSIYGFMENVLVNRGESVQVGQKIGTAGGTGLSRGNRVYFEMRVHGTPVDAREWWDKKWFYGQVTAKINEVKRSLGIPVYKPLN
ncbi:MAG: M23 family metallopeptidase [Oligoflexia bacterium]|nr:M23 family metallopeptidase [Oligoflexia bacterium]